jgi:hypothetical protein
MGAVNGSNSSSGGSDGSSDGGSGQQALPVLLSQHHGLVSALSAAHAAYAPTVRLAKRWLGAHLLLGAQVRLAPLICFNMARIRMFLLILVGVSFAHRLDLENPGPVPARGQAPKAYS